MSHSDVTWTVATEVSGGRLRTNLMQFESRDKHFCPNHAFENSKCLLFCSGITDSDGKSKEHFPNLHRPTEHVANCFKESCYTQGIVTLRGWNHHYIICHLFTANICASCCLYFRMMQNAASPQELDTQPDCVYPKECITDLVCFVLS